MTMDHFLSENILASTLMRSMVSHEIITVIEVENHITVVMINYNRKINI